MDYHRSRFEDFSLLIYKGDKLVGLLPANRQNTNIFSHQGLTYGGLILEEELKFKDVLGITQTILEFLEDKGFNFVYLKQVPRIYHRNNSDEFDYILYKLDAERYRNDLLSVVVPEKMVLSRDRKAGVRRGEKYSLVVKEEEQPDIFWNEILIPNLALKHETQPVHSLEEIQVLKKAFPTKIRQFNVYHNNKIVAGTTIFETDQVAHSQYISGNSDKNSLGSLDYLHHHLLTKTFIEKPFFDFGSSHEDSGNSINEGLLYWKEGFGARSISQAFYKIDLQNRNQLNSVFV